MMLRLAPPGKSSESLSLLFSTWGAASICGGVLSTAQTGAGIDGDPVPQALVITGLVVAFVLALGAFGFAKRVFIATSLGLFSWLALSVPYWNWYRFPLDFTLGSLLEQVLGWMIAGIAMAWWLGRRVR